MKPNNTLSLLAFLLLAAGMSRPAMAAESGSLIVSVKYFMYNNKIPFIVVNTKTKIEKKLQPVPGISFQLYLDSAADNHLIGKVKTNENGNATVAIPPALKAFWDASPKHSILSKSVATKQYDADEQEVAITQAKLVLDTLNDGEARSIVATLMERTDKGWIPVKEADTKIGVKRLGGILSAGSEASYATDEEGKATVAYERENLPGDKNGNITLLAKVEDNETYGNLVVEMNAPWGAKAVAGKHETYNDRTLYSTRFKAPYWLLFIANSIIIIVWGTIIYLIFQLFKLKKLGTEKK